jgi:hypothetical protein
MQTIKRLIYKPNSETNEAVLFDAKFDYTFDAIELYEANTGSNYFADFNDAVTEMTKLVDVTENLTDADKELFKELDAANGDAQKTEAVIKELGSDKLQLLNTASTVTTPIIEFLKNLLPAMWRKTVDGSFEIYDQTQATFDEFKKTYLIAFLSVGVFTELLPELNKYAQTRQGGSADTGK